MSGLISQRVANPRIDVWINEYIAGQTARATTTTPQESSFFWCSVLRCRLMWCDGVRVSFPQKPTLVREGWGTPEDICIMAACQRTSPCESG